MNYSAKSYWYTEDEIIYGTSLVPLLYYMNISSVYVEFPPQCNVPGKSFKYISVMHVHKCLYKSP